MRHFDPRDDRELALVLGDAPTRGNGLASDATDALRLQLPPGAVVFCTACVRTRSGLAVQCRFAQLTTDRADDLTRAFADLLSLAYHDGSVRVPVTITAPATAPEWIVTRVSLRLHGRADLLTVRRLP